MKKRKKIMSIIGIIILLIGGYMLLSRDKVTNDPDETRDQILSFLEKKYGKEFVPMSIEMDRWPYHYDNLRAYPKGGERKKEYFDAYRERKNGKYVYSDSYFGVLIRDEYEEKVKGIADEFFPECRVSTSYSSDSLPNKLNSKSTLQDAIDMNAGYVPIVSIIVAPTFKNVDEFDKNVDLFMPKLSKNDIEGTVNITYLKNNDINVDKIEDSMCQKERRFTIYSQSGIKEYR
jgi:uncharacterized protein YxeA